MRTKVLLPVVVAAAAVIGIVTVAQQTSSGSGDEEQITFGTAKAAVRDLVRTESLNGVIAYRDIRDLSSAQTGIITRLPDAGDDLHSGETLLAINEQPVVLLNGPVPAWRDLEAGITDGIDVQQLEAALLALGYGKPGSGYPDTHWSATTTEVVKQFQAKAGAVTDGVLSLGEVVFTPGDVHVSKVDNHVGGLATPAGSVLTVSSTERVVSLDLDPLDRDLIDEGVPVEVELPSGEKAPGKVDSVGTTLETNADNKQVFKVRVVLDDPAKAGDLALAPVTVHYAATVAPQALSVPVTAIIGVPGGGYAVDVLTPDGGVQRVPVKLGAWGDGYVQVTGEVNSGDTVEVPQ